MHPDLLILLGGGLTLFAMGLGGYRTLRYLNQKVRSLEASAGGAAVLSELDELQARVHELEGERERLLELEERIGFTERLLADRDSPRELKG